MTSANENLCAVCGKNPPIPENIARRVGASRICGECLAKKLQGMSKSATKAGAAR